MKRSSGVLMHLSSLWGDHGIGGAGKCAKEFIDFLSECGFSYWQLLPFCLPDEYNSPYKSHGAFSLNPFFIDLGDLARRGLITDAELESARQKTPYSCEFARLGKERYELLKLASKRFCDEESLCEFYKSHRHTEDFCRFMALKRANSQKPWQEWTINEPDEDELRMWRFSQYIFYEQWKEIKKYANDKGIRLIGDIPIYVSTDSSDVWASKELFRLDSCGYPSSVAGVPPDYFCADGQLWGNPLYDWERMESDGYLWWRERIGFISELFDGVRIDHFRGFESYYSIGAGEKTARNGKWIKGPGMKLVNALKGAAKDCFIIAEDLGDITDEVRALVKESGLAGMRVLQFGFLSENSPHLPHNYPENCVAYTGTHDNNTLLGYVWELDEETRKNLCRYCGYYSDNWDSCYDSVLRTMFASHAGLLILPIQDLLLYGSDTRLNVPGRKDDNWSYRITKEQLENIDKRKFAQWNRLYSR